LIRPLELRICTSAGVERSAPFRSESMGKRAAGAELGRAMPAAVFRNGLRPFLRLPERLDAVPWGRQTVDD